MTPAVVLVYLYLILRNCFWNQLKMFKTSVNARLHCHLTSPFYREPDRVSAKTLLLPEIRVSEEDLRRWQCVSILLIFTQLFFESRTVSASQIGAKTDFNAK